MFFVVNNEKLLEKNESTWIKIEDFILNAFYLLNVKWNALGVYNDRYIKAKLRKYGDKVFTNFRDLNVLKDDIECEPFTVISIDSLLVYENKYYLQVYLDNCAYKIENKQMIDCVDDNRFETDKGWFL